MKQSDPVIDEIREVRRRISARFHHDPALLVAHYLERQGQLREKNLIVANKTPATPRLKCATVRSTQRAKGAERR